MKYALGNMLNGAGGLNPDGLSLDLQFAADKTLTARRGPTPVLTRGSGNNGGTTYFGPSSIRVAGTYEGDPYDVTVVQKPSLGISNGRWVWDDSNGLELKYNGTSWEWLYLASVLNTSAPTTAWRPDLANWSGTGVTVTTGNTFGIVKAANDEPRFDHDPVSPFACRGLLIEEGRTNFLVQSENFGTTWAAAGITVNPNQTESPDGLVTADQITSTISNGAIYQTFSATAGVTYTFSVWVKTVSSNVSTVLRINNNSGTNYASVNITTSLSWQRVTITHTSASTETLRATIGGGSTLGIDATLYVWGAQVEAGSFATSYIPTTTSTLARAADTCNITGDAFNSFYNQSEGTLFADVSGLMNTTLTGNRAFVSISDGTYINFFFIYKNAGSALIRGEGWTNSANQFNYPNTYSPSTQYKVALGFKTNDANIAFNGTLGTTDTSVTMPTTMNRLELRDPTGAAGGQPTGHIAAIRYYKKRLPNAKLQALTA